MRLLGGLGVTDGWIWHVGDDAIGRLGDLEALLNVTPNTNVEYFRWACARVGDATPVLLELEASDCECIVVGRVRRYRPQFSLGYLRIPSPNANVLEVVYGGFHATSVAAASRALTVLRGQTELCIDCVRFNWIPDESPMAMALSAAAYRGSASQPHYVIGLASGGFEGYLGQLSSRSRSDVRRNLRRNEDLELVVVDSPSQWRKWGGSFASVFASSFHGAMGERTSGDGGIAASSGIPRRGYLLLDGDEPIAANTGLVLGDTYFGEAAAYDAGHSKRQPGMVLLMRCLANLAEVGIARYDFGFGSSDLKARFATNSWPERAWRGSHATPRGRLLSAEDRVVTAVARRADALLPAGARGAVQRYWKSRLRGG